MSKKVITTYEKLTKEVKEAINIKYPDGVEDDLQSITNVMKGGTFKGIIFEYVTFCYKHA